MSFINKECPKCGGKLKVSYGQSAYGRRLNYYEEHYCSQCSYALELDDIATPENMRELIIKEDGLWQLICAQSDVKTLFAIRKVLNYKIEKVNELKKNGTITFEGTYVEMSLLKELFAIESVDSNIVKLE